MGLDLALMALVVGVTVIGLQSVGLLLVVALLIIPPASARFWTDHIFGMTIGSAVIGGVSAYCGVVASALFPRLSAGAIIVLMGTCFFTVSLAFGTRRGVLRRVIRFVRLKGRVGRHDLMRASYEYLESMGPIQRLSDLTERPMKFKGLLATRAWAKHRLSRLLAAATRKDLIWADSADRFRLTDAGARLAQQVARNHRLWETFLIRYADIAPTHVDRDADQIEHVLGPELIEELELLLAEEYPNMPVPTSPHPIETTASGM